MYAKASALSQPPSSPTKQKVLTVSELNTLAKQHLEQQLGVVYVVGEISGLTRAASGHIYFSLKDSQSQIQCMFFKQHALRNPYSQQLNEGVRIMAKSSVSLYVSRGQYQCIVSDFRLDGEGLLRQQFNLLRKKLKQEGLFCASKKQTLPRFATRIGIISSPQAAGLQDFIKAVFARCCYASLLLYPATVQGKTAGKSLCLALTQAIERAEVDVLVLCRGGGSYEDLWCFNDEALVRLLATCPIPTISAIGHETDFTLTDEVSDHRAMTPTDAARFAVADSNHIYDMVSQHCKALTHATQVLIVSTLHRLEQARKNLNALHPLSRVTQYRERCLHLTFMSIKKIRFVHQQRKHQVNRLQHKLFTHKKTLHLIHTAQHLTGKKLTHMIHQIQLSVQHLHAKNSILYEKLLSLHPKAPLKRGYTLVHQHNLPVGSASRLQPGHAQLEFSDGTYLISIIERLD